MGTTPIFGFPYPDPSDLVANYPATAQQLAEDVEDAIYDRKILQIVRATDSTNRSTTSISAVDVTGMSVTITPQKSTSAVLVVTSFRVNSGTSASTLPDSFYQITDNSDNPISGGSEGRFRVTVTATANYWVSQVMIGYATPATTSATTYKMRFRVGGANQIVTFENASQTAQMLAIEVSA
jgi:hypothetical protein